MADTITMKGVSTFMVPRTKFEAGDEVSGRVFGHPSDHLGRDMLALVPGSRWWWMTCEDYVAMSAKTDAFVMAFHKSRAANPDG